MTFKFHCRELVQILTGLGRALPKRASLPALKNVHLSGGQGQPARIQATDLDQHVTYTVPDSVSDQAPGILILPHKELMKLIKAGKDDQVTIQSSDSPDTARIVLDGELGRREHFLPVLDPEEWPEAPTPIQVRKTDGQLLELYRSLLPFASSDPARHVITGIRVEPHAQGHTLVATDGRRLCTAGGLVLPDDLNSILPPSKFLEWNRLDGECAVGFHDGHYRIETGPWEIQGRLIDGTYPSWKQVIPDRNDEDQILKLAQEDLPVLEDAIRTLPTGNLTGKDAQDAMIHILAQGDVPALAACDGRGNWAFRPLPHSTITPGEGTALNRRDLLQAVQAGFLVWRFRDELHPLQSTKDGDVHVLMPCRREVAPPVEQAPESVPARPVPVPESVPEPEPETNPNPEKGKLLIMNEQNELNENNEPDLLKMAQAARDQARDLGRTLAELVRRAKAENRANRALNNELASARGVLERLRDISA